MNSFKPVHAKPLQQSQAEREVRIPALPVSADFSHQSFTSIGFRISHARRGLGRGNGAGDGFVVANDQATGDLVLTVF